jgi:hypothetical protein
MRAIRLIFDGAVTRFAVPRRRCERGLLLTPNELRTSSQRLLLTIADLPLPAGAI